MIRLLVLFLGIPIATFSQSKIDYDIYSLLISKEINVWRAKKDTKSEVVVVNCMTKLNHISNYIPIIDEMYSEDKGYANSLLGFYNKPFDILNNDEFIQLLDTFKINCLNRTELKVDGFNLEIPIKIVTKNWFEKLFNIKRVKGYVRAWDKFYKKYPNSNGSFEFSKIAYSENYAIVYVVHKAKPLVGSGALEILIKENGKWNNLAYYSIWNN